MSDSGEDPFRGHERCSNCKALVARAGTQYCESCGASLDAPATERAGADSSSDRFEEFERSPLYRELMELHPPEPTPPRRVTEIVVPLVICTLVLGITTIAFAGVCAPLGILPLALLGFFYVQILKQPKRAISNAPVERVPSLVLDVSAGLTGGSGAQATSVHSVRLQLSDASVRRVDARAQDLVVQGDFGVAYLQDEVLVHFERVAHD